MPNQTSVINFKQYCRRSDVRKKRFQKFIQKQSSLVQNTYHQLMMEVINDPEIKAALRKMDKGEK